MQQVFYKNFTFNNFNEIIIKRKWENMSELERKPDPRLDCLAKKRLSKWSKEEFNKIKEIKPEIFQKKDRLNSLLIEMAASRVLLESFDSPKIIISTKVPLRLGINTSNDDFLIGSIPEVIEIKQNWIFFEDQSVLLVSVPSDEARATARFLNEIGTSEKALSLLNLNKDDLFMLNGLSAIANVKKYVSALSREEFIEDIKIRLSNPLTVDLQPKYWINLSPREMGEKEMLSFLLQASNELTNTLEKSVEAMIHQIAKKLKTDQNKY